MADSAEDIQMRCQTSLLNWPMAHVFYLFLNTVTKIIPSVSIISVNYA